VRGHRLLLGLLRLAPLVLFGLTFLLFGLLSERFLQLATLENIARQASYIGIVAVGMTFVILTGGIDLSVGSLMYLSATVAGLWVLGAGLPVGVGVLAVVGVGVLAGLLHGLLIVRLGIAPFVVTLATLTLYKGLGLALSQSKEVVFPPEILAIGSTRVLGLIPTPVFLFALVVLLAYGILAHTPFGRQVYAVGQDREGARKAGVPVERVLVWVYLISGVCAAVGGLVLVGQFGIVNAGFGEGDEFDAIAAVVLGGTSLFGGRGGVGGTVLGALMLQMVTAGLIFTQVDLYLQPMVFAAILFLAVFLDSARTALLERLERRRIRTLRSTPAARPYSEGRHG
jgi:ribose/xylose/arabinose/galactoside ABC-type transport system permease subunit